MKNIWGVRENARGNNIDGEHQKVNNKKTLLSCLHYGKDKSGRRLRPQPVNYYDSTLPNTPIIRCIARLGHE